MPCELRVTRAIPIRQRRYLQRQRLETKSQVSDQVARGRAHPSWNRCNIPGCWQDGCLYSDARVVLRDQERRRSDASEQVPVLHIMRSFAQAMAAKIWPEAQGDRAIERRKSMAVESFICSPPVRDAFVHFLDRC